MRPEKSAARALLMATGWLSQQHLEFQEEVIAKGQLQRFEPGVAVYRMGDAAGGIYGLVAGALAISMAAPHSRPRFVQFGIPGAWAGEGPFLTGEPRRVEMRAITQCELFHLPLSAMNQMAAKDPEAIRYFARITVGHFDVLTRVIDDLLISAPDRRIAAVLHRAGGLHPGAIPISQAALAGMANASRQQVNVALSRFSANGWVAHRYRHIEIRKPDALLDFATNGDD